MLILSDENMNKEEALARLTNLENEAKELRNIIEAPEVNNYDVAKLWLEEFIKKPFTVNFTKGYITYSLGDQWVFYLDLENKNLFCNYYKVWQIYESKYSLTYDQIKALHEDVVGTALNCKGFTAEFLFHFL